MRHSMRIIAAVWLACQLAGVCAAPIALAIARIPAAVDDDAPCCPGLLPGQICPMHHTREGGHRCVMRNACGSADAALVALTFAVGVLPHVTAPTRAVTVDRALSSIVPDATARRENPELPPPRA